MSVVRSKNNITVLRQFIYELVNENRQKKENCIDVCIPKHGGNCVINTIMKRSFDNVFIKESQKRLITEALDNFKKKRSWYAEHHIPFHYGILLYGPSVSGKSSLATAIHNYFDSNVAADIIPGDKALYVTTDTN